MLLQILLGIFGTSGADIASSTSANASATFVDLAAYIGLLVGVLLAILAIGELIGALRSKK